MCGLTGFISPKLESAESLINKMTDTLTHRGPDDQGIWISANQQIALGHRRLSILDLSSAGHQPMASHSGRFIIVFNGEIYNFLELQKELIKLGHQFQGHSDTEVMLASFEEWGIESAVKKFNGMFALAVFDQKEKKLYLVRDHLGIKPLYYGLSQGAFLFGSELKALRAFDGFENEIDRSSLALYFQYGYVPSPHSIFKNIFKLLPGSILIIDVENYSILPKPQLFWSVNELSQNTADKFNFEDNKHELERLLKDSVKLQMISDVPLGAFLSGGVDSSLVVALMQAQSNTSIKTFSIGFSENQYNEAIFAKAVADHLKTDHTELIVSPEEAMSVISEMSFLYDEPFADSSQIPTYLVSKLAREKVTVSLSGDGGDELFGGYNRYFWAPKIWHRIRWLPLPLRRLMKKFVYSFSPASWNAFCLFFMKLLPSKIQFSLPGDKIYKFASLLDAKNQDEIYERLISIYHDADYLVLNAGLQNFSQKNAVEDFVSSMMLSDLKHYLPDDILTKVDRASMGVGLEARVPLLDHRVVEFAWSLPLHAKIFRGQGKKILRDILYQYVPKKLIERPKMGFSIPLGEWLKGPLKEWGAALLSVDRLKKEGYLDVDHVQKLWKEHLSGKRDWCSILWAILMFELWLNEK